MTFKRPTRAGLAIAALGLVCVAGFAGVAFADDAALPRAAPALVPNKGDTAWMLVSSALVLMMSIPGLALFYGGLVRTKNMASILTQVFCDRLHGRRALGALRLLGSLHGWRQLDAVCRRASPRPSCTASMPTRPRDLLQRRRDSGTRLLRLPDDVRDDHPGPDRRRLCRTHQVLGRACCSSCCGSPSSTSRSRIGSGTWRPRMTSQRLPRRLPPRRTVRPRPRRRPSSTKSPAQSAGLPARAPSTSPAEPSCTSTPASPAWLAR